MSEERRKQPRHDTLHLTYLCVDEAGSIVQEGMGRTLNVSEGGILLETHFAMTAGGSLVVQIALEDELISLQGRIIYCRQQEGGQVCHSGVHFTGIPAEAREALRRFIAIFADRQHRA
ncbi:MAG: PilZ domain-containing protein [Thermodesulfobacteriota bacterium]